MNLNVDSFSRIDFSDNESVNSVCSISSELSTVRVIKAVVSSAEAH